MGQVKPDEQFQSSGTSTSSFGAGAGSGVGVDALAHESGASSSADLACGSEQQDEHDTGLRLEDAAVDCATMDVDVDVGLNLDVDADNCEKRDKFNGDTKNDIDIDANTSINNNNDDDENKNKNENTEKNNNASASDAPTAMEVTSVHAENECKPTEVNQPMRSESDSDEHDCTPESSANALPPLEIEGGSTERAAATAPAHDHGTGARTDIIDAATSMIIGDGAAADKPADSEARVEVDDEAPVVLKTGRDHMRALVRRNMEALPSTKKDEEEEEEDEDDNMSNSSSSSQETAEDMPTAEAPTVNSLRTPWRFVFNAHHELEDEVLNDRGEVTYPKGKKLGGSDGGVMWGATLADFYRIVSASPPTKSTGTTPPTTYAYRRGSSKPANKSPIVTSSMLHARYSPLVTGAERHRRLRQILRIAEEEGAPRVVPVYSIARLIRSGEAWIAQTQQGGASWVRRSVSDFLGEKQLAKEKEIEKEREREAWELPDLWPPESVFSPAASPSPWPLEPFKNYWWQPTGSIKNWIYALVLQQYILLHLLPQKLIVHDPWELLKGERCTSTPEDKATPFAEKDDIVRVYNLSLDSSPRYDDDKVEMVQGAVREEAHRAAFLAHPHSSAERPAGMMFEPRRLSESNAKLVGPAPPPVYVVFPLKPLRCAPEAAHLYISPAQTMGQGNHSYVYRAELEVPRSMLVEDVICEECVRADVKRILEEEDGVDGERRDPRWDDQSAGAYVLRIRRNARRKVMFGSEAAVCEWDDDAKEGPAQTVNVVYEGPYRAIQTTVGYQNLERAPYCEHLRARGESVHPLTTKVQVAAKLSMKYDPHLQKEAENYQAFPKHFFEHKSGYNLPELPDVEFNGPVPSGAVAPQFYGYYQEDWRDEKNKDLKGKRSHLSPILLVEDCGHSIVPETMTVDDRNECLSLILRMHAAGWHHGSLYRRNIVRQRGPLSEHPMIRRDHSLEGRGGYGEHWSFRVIDFGRTDSRYEMGSYSFHANLEYEKEKLKRWVRDGVLT